MTTTDSLNQHHASVPSDARPRLGLLRYTDTSGAQNLVKLNRRVFTIGRTRDNDVTIEDDLISGHHAEVIFDGRGYTYHDKLSPGGSFMQRQRISQRQLRHGDAIRLGSEDGATLTFLFSPPSAASWPPSLTESQARAAERAGGGDPVADIKLLNQVGRALAECADGSAVASCLLESLGALPNVERATVLLYDRMQGELTVGGVRDIGGAGGGEAACVTRPDGPVARVLAERAARRGYDWERDEFYLCAPLASAAQVGGVVYLSTRERAFKEEELEAVAAVGHQAGLALENVRLVAEQRRTCESLMHALALSIDARDGITAGHSARVAAYSAATARHMGLPALEERLTYYAGLLHDYGKIAVRDEVLCKPSRLTPEEYEDIKQHARYTLSILSKIHFTEDLADVPHVASCHHERPDGQGYPRGLKRDEIPVGARIIAVADFFDALTVERHYRRPMPVDEVFQLLEAGRDTQFDGAALDAFRSYYEAELKPRLARRE
jgi:response regulator RpfG family c-di-GMP phosphodiesterase